MASYTLMVFVFVALGFVIIASELVIPSAGLLSLLALLSFSAATWCAWKGWYEVGKPVWWWGYVLSMVLLLPSFIGGGLYLLPRTPLGHNLFAIPQRADELTPFDGEERRLQLQIGQTGTALTLFSPGGMARIGHERFHAESEGLLIDPGTDIVVVDVAGTRLVVRPLTVEQSVTGEPAAAGAAPPDGLGDTGPAGGMDPFDRSSSLS